MTKQEDAFTPDDSDELAEEAVAPVAQAAARQWFDAPPRFLAQPRAQSTLRREFDLLATQLSALVPHTTRERGVRGVDRVETHTDPIVELHSLPHRLILRMGEMGLSFSWVNNGTGSVADGRLLVILWRGVSPQQKGVAALKSATPVREASYRVEATDPDTWLWRGDDGTGQVWSTVNLAASWLAGAQAAA